MMKMMTMRVVGYCAEVDPEQNLSASDVAEMMTMSDDYGCYQLHLGYRPWFVAWVSELTLHIAVPEQCTRTKIHRRKKKISPRGQRERNGLPYLESFLPLSTHRWQHSLQGSCAHWGLMLRTLTKKAVTGLEQLTVVASIQTPLWLAWQTP
jgi:hypothetical protein